MADGYTHAKVPTTGERITYAAGRISVPSNPIIPFIEVDGTGPVIWKATRRVLDAAVEKASSGKNRIVWMEVYAGEKAFNKTGEWLPEETLNALQEFKVGIKGPLATPVGGGIRSLNVTMRQVLDLYACIRPVRYIPGVPSPV
jgi:isocitrate dehydrogenase